MKTKVVVIMSLLILILLSSQLYPNTSKERNSAHGHWYQRFDTIMNWTEVKRYYESIGTHLTTNNFPQENDFVFSNPIVGSHHKARWFGSTSDVIEGCWKWETNEVWPYSDWEDVEPTNFDVRKYYLRFYSPLENFHTSSGLRLYATNDCPHYELPMICEWKSSINVSLPDGCDILAIDYAYNISWKPKDIGIVKIEYKDCGNTWKLITSLTNNGYGNWITQNVPSSNCKMRISCGDVSDKNDTAFSKVTALPELERAALIELYNATGGDSSWSSKKGWKDGLLHSDGFAMPGTEYNWYGITVSSSHVTRIDLHNNNLTGNIPSEIEGLSNLESLLVQQNNLNGLIPTTLGNLNNLIELNLGSNNLTGGIPTEIFNLKNLEELDLGGNKTLGGTIPIEINNLSKLTKLAIGWSNLSGDIPDQIFDITHLEHLNMGGNNFTNLNLSNFSRLTNLKYLNLKQSHLSGSIPEEFFNITKLEQLSLTDNNLSGSIPKKFSRFTNLRFLNLEQNKFSDEIPKELFNLQDLQEIRLSINKLSGSIPKEIGNLNKMTFLDLKDNNLTDTIPRELGNLINLTHLNLSDNSLSHEIPEELGNLMGLTELYLDHNILSGEIPLHLQNLSELKLLDIGYNCLSTSNSSLMNWLNSISPDWNTHQSQCSSTYTLTVQSYPVVDVPIIVTPNDNNNLGDGETSFSRIYNNGTIVTLSAPAEISINGIFQKWVVDEKDHYNQVLTITMNGSHTVRAVYQASVYTLTVKSSPYETNALINVSPIDNNELGDGWTEFQRTYNAGTVVSLTAQPLFNGNIFDKWLIDDSEYITQTVQLTMSRNIIAQAVFQSSTYDLEVLSSPSAGVNIMVSPSDNNGYGNDNSNFTRTYNSNTTVTLTAPLTFGGGDFLKWLVNNQKIDSPIVQVNMDGNKTAVVYYSTPNPPEISLDPSLINFGYVKGSGETPIDSFKISNTGGGTLNWRVNNERGEFHLSTESGTNNGVVEVTLLKPEDFDPGQYEGFIRVSDPLVYNSPVDVTVSMKIIRKSESTRPFGILETPINGSTVRSNVPISGWALSDTGIKNVKIYREGEKGLVYIGDAVLVKDARPDISENYPDYPMNNKAGWGYMMLTNFLPNGGNGEFTIHAIATDNDAQTTTLGIITIIVDNANTNKPFGTIDTPTQGGTASGSNYINWGWALTPQPNRIPQDGSTIGVFIDGIKIGSPQYNNYRSDIATLFPNYKNSSGATGYFILDTTKYYNGIHNIHWIVEDDAGNIDGIGSRYFKIENYNGDSTHNNGTETFETPPNSLESDYNFLSQSPGFSANQSTTINIRRGFNNTIPLQEIRLDENGSVTIEIRPLERIEVFFNDVKDLDTEEPTNIYQHITGYLLVGDKLNPLPIGSTLDCRHGIFYWHPGPGFYGVYELVFIKHKGVHKKKYLIKILIAQISGGSQL